MLLVTLLASHHNAPLHRAAALRASPVRCAADSRARFGFSFSPGGVLFPFFPLFTSQGRVICDLTNVHIHHWSIIGKVSLRSSDSFIHHIHDITKGQLLKRRLCQERVRSQRKGLSYIFCFTTIPGRK